jgi:hypothetical protein
VADARTYTVPEAARRLGVTPDAIRGRVSRRALEYVATEPEQLVLADVIDHERAEILRKLGVADVSADGVTLPPSVAFELARALAQSRDAYDEGLIKITEAGRILNAVVQRFLPEAQ